MPATAIADIVVPEVFAQYMMRETAEKARIFQSGLAQANGVISNFLNGGGQTVNLPQWTDLSGAPNISSDDSTSSATPLNVAALSDVAIRHNRNQAWTSADLVAAFAGDDPLKMVVDRVSTYWANRMDAMFVNSLEGVFADNIANDAGDMVNDVSLGTGLGNITAEAIIDTAATMGDADDRLAAIVMHSSNYAQLAKLNLIDFIPDARGEVRFPSYLGYNVIRDDDCFFVNGRQHVYLVARDALAWGEASARVPVEIERKPEQADGGGVEELWTRRQFCLHPYGFAWLSASMVGLSPTDAELALAANWNRIATERKQVGMAMLITDIPGVAAV
jgi:hypothetical protein